MTLLKLLAFCLPSLAFAAIISYNFWKGKRDRSLPPSTTASPLQKEAKDERSPKSPEVSLSQMVTTSPSDSGFTEQSTPLLLQTSQDEQLNDSSMPGAATSAASNNTNLPSYHPPPPPPTSTSVEEGRQLFDTTAIRGGRVRATLQLPVDVIGRFIGRQGRNIKTLMSESGSQIHVQQKNLSKDSLFVPCIIQGTQTQINAAIDLILARHPEVSFTPPPPLPPPIPPVNTVGKINSEGNADKDTSKWDHVLEASHCPTGVFLAIVTYIEKLNHVWLVPYTSTQLLETLHQNMTRSYVVDNGEEGGVSDNATPITGKFCSVRVSEEYWLRGQVLKERDEGNFEVRLVDYGSSVIVPRNSIKPLRKEHTLLKMQAFSCQLSNIEPNNTNVTDGMLVLQALVEGTVLEVHVIVNEKEADPLVELYIPSHYGSGGQAFINRELVNQGFAVWSESAKVPSVKEATPLTSNDRVEEEMPIGRGGVEGVVSLPLVELFKRSGEEESESILDKPMPENKSLLGLLSGTPPPEDVATPIS